MSRRSKGTSGVKGPNSALTEFLRVEGITDAFRERRQREDTQSPTPSVAPSSSPTRSPSENAASPRRRTRRSNEETTQVVDEDEVEIRAAARRKRRARRNGGDGSDDSDDDDDDFNLSDDNDIDDDDPTNEFKKFGDEDECVDCGDVFKLSVYSRYDASRKGYLCESCNENLKKRERNARRNELNARKKRKKTAEALLNKTSVKMPLLQDICIKKITQNINDVDVLGDIGQLNMNKISRILSKNRSLNNSTMSLFLNPNLKALEFWDCSNVDSDSLNKIASFCPHLESLTLFMCGHLHNDNLIYYKSNLTKLSELSLNGPFLISDSMWQDFFEGDGGLGIKKFEVRNTHRFGNDSLISLLENCGKELTSLKLSHLDGIDSQAVYDLIPHYIQPNNLTHLELSHPHKPELITNDLLINILSIAGESLKSLNVDECSELTDTFLIEGVARFCPNLTDFSCKGLDLLTDDGFATAFLSYPSVNTGGLINADLTKCTGLGNKAVHALFLHSAATLVELSLNSCYNITKDFLLQIFTDDLDSGKQALREAIENGEDEEGGITTNQNEVDVNEAGGGAVAKREFFSSVSLSFLTKWDLGFVRAVDDEVLALISDNCSKLAYLEVYGCNRCTGNARVRSDLMVIGRQHDII